ncbi:MAG: SURF1 family protein [Acidimicrobiia bacterium]|nr:SURF1 family protein [Acidimicrobiia bacterium]
MPRWIVGHLVALAAIALFVSLGFWQFDRLEERRELNSLVTARMELDVTSLETLTAGFSSFDGLEYRKAFVTGEYLADSEVMYLLVSRNGLSGHVLLTPLQVEGSTRVVLVERGWVPADAEGPPVPGAEPPDGTVTVTGRLLDADDRRRDVGSVDLETRRITTFDRLVLDEAITGDLLPMILRLESQVPEARAEPGLMPGPVLTEGPHLGYAVQWILFAGVVLVGYPVLLYRTARRRNALAP